MTLTPKQDEVMRLLCKGHTQSEIARDLGVSRNAIHLRRNGALVALGAKTNEQAVYLWLMEKARKGAA
jgi:DNA-binding NarL/FixJ family response regulator